MHVYDIVDFTTLHLTTWGERGGGVVKEFNLTIFFYIYYFNYTNFGGPPGDLARDPLHNSAHVHA